MQEPMRYRATKLRFGLELRAHDASAVDVVRHRHGPSVERVFEPERNADRLQAQRHVASPDFGVGERYDIDRDEGAGRRGDVRKFRGSRCFTELHRRPLLLDGKRIGSWDPGPFTLARSRISGKHAWARPTSWSCRLFYRPFCSA